MAPEGGCPASTASAFSKESRWEAKYKCPDSKKIRRVKEKEGLNLQGMALHPLPALLDFAPA
jgi:hypothetical protein